MDSPISFSDYYALVFGQRIRAVSENLDLESKSEARGEDRISRLPDAVLRHVLSFIPSTKCVVRTSILSTRWKHIWTCVPNLYFDDREFFSSANFVAFVDRVLLVRDSAAIQKFHLHFNHCPTENFSLVDGWICTAVRCNVVELDLSLDAALGEMFELPKCLLTCKTLMIWKLFLNYVITIPTSGFCPSLKVLHVTFYEPKGLKPGTDSMDFSHYPVLEYLTIDGSLGLCDMNFNVSVPELKTLRISLVPDFNQFEPCNFLINAPKLEKLDINEGFYTNYTFENTNSLVEANIGVINFAGDENKAIDSRVTKLLAGISCVQCLTLSSPLSTACSVPVFDNLSKLTLVRDGHWWKTLMKFLERSRNLESFVINHEACRPGYLIQEEEVVIDLSHLTRNPDYVEVPYWTPPESVPKCLLSSLKTISIKGFKGKGFFGYLDEMEMIMYLLENCLVLERMTIYTPGLCWGTKDEFYNEISESEWGSKTVQVQMIKKEFYRGDRFGGGLFSNV